MKKRYDRLGTIRSILRSHFASGTRSALRLGAAGSALLSATMVHAQASPDATVGPTVIEERGTAASDAGDIIVTARRKDERLQDVPVSVTVIGGQQLVEQRISTEKDLQKATPGLYVRETTTSNQLSFSLRGQSVDAFSASSPAVLTYLNEVTVGGVGASSFFDLESIQDVWNSS